MKGHRRRMEEEEEEEEIGVGVEGLVKGCFGEGLWG